MGSLALYSSLPVNQLSKPHKNHVELDNLLHHAGSIIGHDSTTFGKSRTGFIRNIVINPFQIKSYYTLYVDSISQVPPGTRDFLFLCPDAAQLIHYKLF